MQSYEDFKKGLPDVGWLHSILPSNESVDAFRGSMIKFKDKFRDSFSGFEFGESYVFSLSGSDLWSLSSLAGGYMARRYVAVASVCV